MEKILLIVDDNKEVIEVLQETLKGLFDKVVSAPNVSEAICRLSENVFSFMILDINLEGRNGAEVVRFLHERPDNLNNNCPVVILSGLVNPEFIGKYEQRFAGVMLKPFDEGKLITLVKDLLSKQVEAVKVSVEDSVDIPVVRCAMPFNVPDLEKKVAGVLSQVKKNPKLKQLFADMKIDRGGDTYLMTHIGMLINISTSLCMKMEWDAAKTLEKFVFASYLHDMALADRPDLARVHGSTFELGLIKDTLTAEDYKMVMEHPNVAANSLEGIPGVPMDVDTIIRQHHELPKENGFPAKLAHSKITPLATVFIVSHDLVDYILDNPKWNITDYITKARSKFKGQHFAKILSALNDMN